MTAQIQFDQDDHLPEAKAEHEFLTQVLSPYKAHCQYLTATHINPDADSVMQGMGEFSIPSSCYIDDTGHFNSVEFNICYNQLMYFSIAKAVQAQSEGLFQAWSMAEFWQKQLPDILIVQFNSRFKRPLNSQKFYGQIDFVRAKNRGGNLHLSTEIQFFDNQQGLCKGEVQLVIVNSPSKTLQGA